MLCLKCHKIRKRFISCQKIFNLLFKFEKNRISIKNVSDSQGNFRWFMERGVLKTFLGIASDLGQPYIRVTRRNLTKIYKKNCNDHCCSYHHFVDNVTYTPLALKRLNYNQIVGNA